MGVAGEGVLRSKKGVKVGGMGGRKDVRFVLKTELGCQLGCQLGCHYDTPKGG